MPNSVSMGLLVYARAASARAERLQREAARRQAAGVVFLFAGLFAGWEGRAFPAVVAGAIAGVFLVLAARRRRERAAIMVGVKAAADVHGFVSTAELLRAGEENRDA